MKNRWELPLDADYSVVEEFIKKVELIDEFNEEFDGFPEIDLSDSRLSPYTLQKWLEGMGYEELDTDTNGWQWDYWITMKKSGCKTLLLSGTAIIFELKLGVR